MKESMKKFLLSLIAIAFLVASCGPSAKELEDKRIADSIMAADSIALVQASADTVDCDTVHLDVVMETVVE